MHKHHTIWTIVLGLFLAAGQARSQSGLVCQTSAVAATQRTEGLTERLGDILLTCSGGRPGMPVTGEMRLTLSVNVTNKLSGSLLNGIALSVDAGTGAELADVPAKLGVANEVVFNGIAFTIPADGRVALRISNVRGDATHVAPGQPVTGRITLTLGGTTVNNSQFIVGYSRTGLLASFSHQTVTCTGSPLPETITMTNLFARGTRFFSTRITEGFSEAFLKVDAFSDTGTRIRIAYSGFPAGARLFVPNAVAGSSAVEPTAGGDMGVAKSGGVYEVSSAGSLLLIRVLGADAKGAGGTLAMAPPASGSIILNAASEVELMNGEGSAVYEVVDSNFYAQESAQIPTFLGLASNSGETASPEASLTLAPISTVDTASSAPVPRFIASRPPSDCAAVGDCSAAYFPHLDVRASKLEMSVPAHSASKWLSDVTVLNSGSGDLNWTASLVYPSRSGWLTMYPSSGTGLGSIRLVVQPGNLEAGTYQAILNVDAGPLAGSRSIPITLTVTAAMPLAPLVTGVKNLANLRPGTAPSAWTAIEGTNLAQTTRSWALADIVSNQLPTQLDGVSVTVNGAPAYISFVSPTRINVLVPDGAGEGNVPVEVVMPQGKSSLSVAVARLSPALFMLEAEGGKYVAAVHADGTYAAKVNLSAGLATRPAKPGDIVSLFGTGFGATDPPVPAVQAYPQASPLAATPSVRIGGVQANVLWAGLISPGLYQLTVTVPDVPDGDGLVEAEIDGFHTQANAYITVQK